MARWWLASEYSQSCYKRITCIFHFMKGRCNLQLDTPVNSCSFHGFIKLACTTYASLISHSATLVIQKSVETLPRNASLRIFCSAVQYLLFTFFYSTAVKITTTYPIPISLIWNLAVQETEQNCMWRLQKHMRQQRLTEVNIAQKCKYWRYLMWIHNNVCWTLGGNLNQDQLLCWQGN